ncbi:MAG: phosphoribosylaminoimidazolecarboxamide formyltransferase/IMP cyclohydrolase, phosphoribosylaminoimidazolecarboxamide formyltransferase / IMP cyclohydrolase [Berkelbacteria bacterium GW2011_GWE1_39_12]|uniref:Phosphoribosylaminoimidazolecarboxamide formyltransferase/IMP cyclohydrolase, phosphoribosylaminoimidazolecarboxamide formyltransferase / IMP cyclohydrolase n=1 Tax=Berkelbacteria bacterium GW2011_GWE1_39_12 TaxID=1618337 RepID=A0A0G4B3E0_9BACT|nr:MAG: phosphoribosylaminoimidazolecarboxamide formyltransferase/IMP cyclohydrolase, phosphoribosylaminoimidazolecarboxamide formyltransferase / IMP cyclohydrolase [Berkelbacteria bacterium GW2011_GWE1_39_12]
MIAVRAKKKRDPYNMSLQSLLKFKKIALVSVYDKTNLAERVRRLTKQGYGILSSGGTAKMLRENKIRVCDVATLVGGGAILGHKVVTLSREVHAGLLAADCEIEVLEQLGIPRIDLVAVDLYPLEEEIAKPDCTRKSVIEKTDIGGPTMLSSAAKGGRIVISIPEDWEPTLTWIESGCPDFDETVNAQRAKADYVVAKYRLLSANYHSGGIYAGVIGRKVRDLAYGENRDQSPSALYEEDPTDSLGMGKFDVLTGDPSHISVADGDRALGVMCAAADAFRLNCNAVPFIAVACKHGAPCGIGVSFETRNTALERALMGDSIAVMGAEVMTNFAIDEDLGRLLYEVPESLRAQVGCKYWGIDVLYAPAVDDATIDLLGKKERRRILVNPALIYPFSSKQELMGRPVRGGFLSQKAYHFILDLHDLHLPLTAGMNDDQKIDAIIAWAACWRSVSNTVALANDGTLIGLGCGQQDRIACVELCLNRAKRSGHNTNGSMFASDAFFPFAKRKREEDPLEGPEILIQAGCAGGIVPHDGKNIEEVSALFDEHKLLVGYLPSIHRGFFGH